MFRILLPTDFSQNAVKALDYVFEHFKVDQVELKLIHTIKAPHSAAGVLIRIDDLMRKDAEAQMSELLAYVESKHGVRPNHIIKIGHLTDWLKQFGKSSGIDLIVMGTKGESNLSSKLMGSVTESVIRTSKIPVLAIPDLETYSSLHHIAIATAKEEVEYVEFLKEVIGVLKLENPRINSLKVKKDEFELSPKSLSIEGYQIGVESVVNKSVVDGINNYIDEVKTDLLVLYHKHSSKMDYFFNRSVTKTICSNTSVPLLVVPARLR